jgi:hypothetical protein
MRRRITKRSAYRPGPAPAIPMPMRCAMPRTVTPHGIEPEPPQAWSVRAQLALGKAWGVYYRKRDAWARGSPTGKADRCGRC